MPRHAHYVPHGVIPAVLLPFSDDLVDRREELPRPSARRGSDQGAVRHHRQRAFDRGRLLQLRRAAARARHRAGRDRRPAAAGQRGLGRRQHRSRADRAHGGGRRRLGAAGVSAGAVHLGAVAGDGARAFQAHRRRDRPADHRVPVPARHRPGLSARHAAQAGRAGADASAPSRTGRATCRSTKCTSARCRACRGRSTCSPPTAPGCSPRWCWAATGCSPAAAA